MRAKEYVSRVTISISSALLDDLDMIVREKSYSSRSQAVSEMIHSRLVDHRQKQNDAIMVGTVTLFYNRKSAGLQNRLADLQFDHIDEVISSLHVHLTHDRMLEVILVQGPASALQRICDDMMSVKGVITGSLQLMAAMIPPIHPLPREALGGHSPTRKTDPPGAVP